MMRKRRRLNTQGPTVGISKYEPVLGSATPVNGTVGTTGLDYFRIAFEVLQSLTLDKRIKRFIGNLLLEPAIMLARRNYISIVTWPAVWHGIFQQFQLDLPREHVIWQGRQWKLPYALLQELESAVGPIWARWLCVFVNQSPMADVFSTVWSAQQQKYGPDVYICQGVDPLEITIETSDTLSVTFVKSFRVLSTTRAELGAVDTRYRVVLYPEPSVQLDWK